jgi:hypothetical protein
VVGVLVGHTHFDHAVDAPAIARRFGCEAYGSNSLLNLMALHGLADRTVVVEPYRAYELGPFVVRFTPWGISIEVAGVRFYHQGSANLIDDAVRERGVDVSRPALRAAGRDRLGERRHRDRRSPPLRRLVSQRSAWRRSGRSSPWCEP